MFDFIFDVVERSIDRVLEDVEDILDGKAFNPLHQIEKNIERFEEDLGL